jgi:hypothetical protein
MKKSRSKFLKIVDEKHDINFHWPHRCVKSENTIGRLLNCWLQNIVYRNI